MDDNFMVKYIPILIDILSLMVISVTAFLVYRQMKSDHDWNRRKTAYDFIMEVNEGPFRELRCNLEKKINIHDEKQTYDTLKSSLDNEDRMTLDAILNYLDDLCLLIRKNIVDQDIAFDCMAFIIIDYKRWASPYIEETRKTGMLFWKEIGPIAEKWSKRIKEMDAPKGKKRKGG